jgi:hypothetical protein
MGPLIFLGFTIAIGFMVAIIALFVGLKNSRNPGRPGANKSDSGFWAWFDGNSGGSGGSDSTHHGSSHDGHSGTSHHGGGFDGGGGHHGGGFGGGHH